MRLLAITFILLAGCKITTGPTTPPVPPAGPPVCNAQHVWENYHLAHDSLSLVVVNTSSYEPDLEAWNSDTHPIRLRDSGTGFTITVKDGGDANSGWLGLASVWVNSKGHILRGEVTMNLTLLARYGPNVAAHVLTQELGHLLGLDHQRGADDSAMDDCQGRGAGWLSCLDSVAGMTPNAHDFEQLREIYAHVPGAPVPPKPPTECEGSEQLVLHVFPAEDGGDHDHS